MNIGRVGHPDVARYQFGKHELMDRGGGRMNPPQLLGSPKLLRVELPSNQNLGIRNFMGKIVQIGKLREMMFGELVLQPRTKPVRRVPQFKAVMNGEKDFQRE